MTYNGPPYYPPEFDEDRDGPEDCSICGGSICGIGPLADRATNQEDELRLLRVTMLQLGWEPGVETPQVEQSALIEHYDHQDERQTAEREAEIEEQMKRIRAEHSCPSCSGTNA